MEGYKLHSLDVATRFNNKRGLNPVLEKKSIFDKTAQYTKNETKRP